MAFAQTSTTTKDKKQANETNTQPTTTPKPGTGTVTTTFEPGKVIVVGSEGGDDTFSYVLDKTARYVDKSGRKINGRNVKPGTRIQLYFDDTGQPPVVKRVVIDKD
jgi:hypothetical protein